LVSSVYSLSNQNGNDVISIAHKFKKQMQHFSSSHLVNS